MAEPFLDSPWRVYCKETSEGKFFYVDVGSGPHNRPDFRLWISSKLVKEETSKIGRPVTFYYLYFPVKAFIKKTERGTMILKPADNTVVFPIFLKSGFRGGASMELLRVDKDIEVHKYVEYHSPRGALGVSVGWLIVSPIPNSFFIKWGRSGRLYGSPSEGITKVVIDENGKVKLEQFEGLADGLAELEELKKELE